MSSPFYQRDRHHISKSSVHCTILNYNSQLYIRYTLYKKIQTPKSVKTDGAYYPKWIKVSVYLRDTQISGEGLNSQTVFYAKSNKTQFLRIPSNENLQQKSFNFVFSISISLQILPTSPLRNFSAKYMYRRKIFPKKVGHFIQLKVSRFQRLSDLQANWFKRFLNR